MDEKLDALIGTNILYTDGSLSKVVSTAHSLNEKIPLLVLENGFILNATIAKDEHGTFVYT